MQRKEGATNGSKMAGACEFREEKLFEMRMGQIIWYGDPLPSTSLRKAG